MHPRYFQVGGVIDDIPPGWEAKCREFLADMPSRIDQYEALVDPRDLPAAHARRGRGAARDPGRPGREPGRCSARPATRGTSGRHSPTPRTTTRFKIPVGTVGDHYDRYRVRMAEMRESLHIVEQALDGRPEGPYITSNRKVALPPRHELATAEALIHRSSW